MRGDGLSVGRKKGEVGRRMEVGEWRQENGGWLAGRRGAKTGWGAANRVEERVQLGQEEHLVWMG